ncbi:unnamed protein product, partial [Didymodactylos carnosus]
SECPPLKENQLRLYGMRFCPFVHRAKLVLAAKGIPYEEVNVDLVNKPEWYLAKNPPGQVPALEWIADKQTKFIPESFVVSDYLDEFYPEHHLHPLDPYHKAKQRVLTERVSNLITAFYKIAHSEDKAAIDGMKKHLSSYENSLEEKFFGGAQPAMVDYMMWPWFERLPLLADAGFTLDSNQFPKLASWIKSMENVKAVKECKVPEDIMRKFMQSYKDGKPVYDFE